MLSESDKFEDHSSLDASTAMLVAMMAVGPATWQRRCNSTPVPKQDLYTVPRTHLTSIF